MKIALLILIGLAQAQQVPLEGIAHVGYRARDLGKTGAFYTGVLGLPLAFRDADGAVFYRVNDEQYLEFSPGLGAQDDVRLTHVALTTTDIQALWRRLQSHGARAGLGNHSEAPIVE